MIEHDHNTRYPLTHTKELLIEAGFSEDEVSSVDVPTGGMNITTQTEFETYSAPEGWSDQDVDCTEEEFETCCDVESLSAAGLEQEL